MKILWQTSLVVKGKRRNVHSNITADMNFSNIQTLMSLVVFVWTLWLLCSLPFTAKNVCHKIFKKILSAVLLSKHKTRFCSEFDWSKYIFASWSYTPSWGWKNIRTDTDGRKRKSLAHALGRKDHLKAHARPCFLCQCVHTCFSKKL